MNEPVVIGAQQHHIAERVASAAAEPLNVVSLTHIDVVRSARLARADLAAASIHRSQGLDVRACRRQSNSDDF